MTIRHNYIARYNKDQAPKSLKGEPFYGLTLDPDQEVFRDAIWDPSKKIIVCEAKSGSGKSTISLGTANLLVQYGFYNGIVYIMSPTMEQRLGYLPGSLEEKAAPYMQALCDACYTLGIDPNQAIISEENSQALKEGKAFIQFITDTFMRGINIENKVVIVDECQNFYFDLLKKTLTRIHDSCKLIIIGQKTQCDLVHKPEKSGFGVYIDAFEKANDSRIQICKLNTNHRGWISNFCDDIFPPYIK